MREGSRLPTQRAYRARVGSLAGRCARRQRELRQFFFENPRRARPEG